MNPVEQFLADLPTLSVEQRAERLRALTPEELADLGERLNAALAEAREATPSDESIATIRRIAECATAAGEVVAEREAESERLRTEQEAVIAEAEAAINGETEPQPDPAPDPPAADPPADPANDPAVDPPADPAADPAPAADPVPEAVAAAAPPRVPLRRVRRPEQHEPAPQQLQQAIVAAAGVEGGDANGHFRDLVDVAGATIRMAARVSGARTEGVRWPVAQLRTPYPDERTLLRTDTEGNTRKLEAVTTPQAIAAAGGLCAPVPVSYAIPGFGTATRPVRAAIPNFGGQDRGGIRFTPAPVLGDYAEAVGRWTTTTDTAAATDSTLRKPCLRVDCGDEEEVLIEAITQCLTVGNLMGRTYPERVARIWELVGITYARTAEADLLTKMGTLSTQVTTDQLLGATRDMLAILDMATAAMRDTHRMGDGERLRAILPRWVRSMIRTDLARELPGSTEERLRVADATIDSFFESRNVTVTWALDTEDGLTFATQADGALVNYPDDVTWLLYPEGTFALVELPELDLGIVRDSTLNSANDYQMWMEGFENVAKPGTISYRLTSTLCANGAAAGTIDPDTICTAEGS